MARWIDFSRRLLAGLAFAFAASSLAFAQAPEKSVRETIAAAAIAPTPAEQREIILSLKLKPTPETVTWFENWKSGKIFLYDDAGVVTPVILTGKADDDESFATLKLADDTPYTTADGKPVRINPKTVQFAETDSGLRKAMKEVSDIVALANPDLAKRLRAIQDAAVGQKVEKLPALLVLKTTEKNPKALKALEESIAIIQLRSPVAEERLAACEKLGKLNSLAAHDTIMTIRAEAENSGDTAMANAAKSALRAIDDHLSRINAVGTLFHGLSSGSVLLVVAIGLAITFGLMGIINMAHGEFIAVGAYTTYIIQKIFTTGLNISPFGMSMSIPGMNLSETNRGWYFVVAIPASFIIAALVGVLLERLVIQYLYKRPLESLLATWGISLVMQQILKFIFGSNNVEFTSPLWLSGNWTVNDIVFGWNRVFVIGFAVLIIVVTWLVLNRTSLGLLIRAVMQNRNMAACMGIRTERVNTMTFAFGCGLAGLAGAFLSQIANVNPAMGQVWIVDSFMTVVVGGVGNIMGTVISATGIGVSDQTLQQYLGNPVIGKILVLGAIILFLQWRPAGLFVTRSRSLD